MNSDDSSKRRLQWWRERPLEFYRQLVLVGGGLTLGGIISSFLPATYVFVAGYMLMMAAIIAWPRSESAPDGDLNGE